MVKLAQADPSYKFSASAIELYLNDCNDLLNSKAKIPIAGMSSVKGISFQTGTETGGLKANYDENGKWVAPDIFKVKIKPTYEAQGQKEIELNSEADVFKIMELVEITRSSKSHQINHRSSRSHCIVQLNCIKKTGKSIVKSQFLFVDLAGSERVHKSGSTNLKAEEAKNINMSLTTLGRCILALKDKKTVAPFRESSLTMLLKDSISGNSKTCIFCTIADEPDMVGESVSTLRFGMNCGQVKLKATAQKSTNLEGETLRLEKILMALNKDLQSMRAQGQNGQMDESHPKPTRDQFLNNLKQFEQAREGVYKNHDNPTLKEQYNFQMQNFRGILIRQIMTGIYKEPSSHYLTKLNEQKRVAAELQKLTGKSYPSGAENEIVLTQKDLWTEFMLADAQMQGM